MAINKCDLEEILKDLPSKWREALIKILLEIQDDRESVSCEEVRECETLTSLSEFTQNGTEICITYKDENEVSVERCFDVANIINNIFSTTNINPGCVTDPTTWDTMTVQEKIQALIDTVCNCCPETTSTSTTTTTTEEVTTSTTTTTTEEPTTTTSTSTTTTTTL